MNWKEVGKAILGAGAPTIGGMLDGPAGVAIGGFVARQLGVDETPEAVTEAVSRNPGAAQRLQEIEANNRGELQRLELETLQAQIAETNKTARAEIASDDPYVRHTRPKMLRMVTYTLAFQVCASITTGIAAILLRPDDATAIIAQLATINNSVMIPITTALAACGVYVRSRSTHDKPVAAGQEPPRGLIQQLLAGRG